MAGSIGLWVLFFMVVGSPLARAIITCSDVTSSLGACIPYLQGGALSSGCCPGLKSLNAVASTAPDRKSAFNCLKAAATSNSGINYGLAEGLPAKCGVSDPYKISPSTDCNMYAPA